MKLKHLEAALSSNIQREFNNPKVTLEQYPTSAHLTANILHMAVTKYGDIDDKTLTCCDLGCGTGMLSMGCILVGCPYIISIDCDCDALDIANENVNYILKEYYDDDYEEEDDEEEEEEDDVYNEDENGENENGIENEQEENHFSSCRPVIEFIQAQVQMNQPLQLGSGGGRGGRGGRKGGGRGGKGRGRGGKQQSSSSTSSSSSSLPPQIEDWDGIPLPSNCVDTVLTNPPFGTKHNAGLDVQFLKTAIRLARKAVYSFHKRSTRPYLLKLIRETWGYTNTTVVAEMKFDIPQMYKFHNQKSVDIEVDLIRISIT